MKEMKDSCSLLLHTLFLAILVAIASACSDSTSSSTNTDTLSELPSRDPQHACDSLVGTSIANAVINSTELIGHPEYCRVQATIPPMLNFVVRLPTEWNRRLLFTGGGLLNGVILPPERAVFFNQGLSESGYVIVATDSGHQGKPLDASWALDDEEAIENFGFKATHAVLLAAEAIVEESYGTTATWSYFIGQSGGGREGLMEAQRYPEDFDGIVALEPGVHTIAMVFYYNKLLKQIFVSPDNFLSTNDVSLVATAVMDTCDSLDGLEDGIISNLSACQFDPSNLLCVDNSDVDCLTEGQLASVNIIHSRLELGIELANGVRSFPGSPLGAEDGPGGWSTWIFGNSFEAPSSVAFTFQDQFVKNFVTKNPEFNSLLFDPNDYLKELQSLSSQLDATDPDLSDFSSRGGKLILWHGLADYAITANATIEYYEQVVSTAGGIEKANEFIRFYTSPGVDHFNTGVGPGYTNFMTAIQDWVERGIAPNNLVSYKLDPVSQEVVLSRPLCLYPDYPRYKGLGDTAAADSFDCVAP